MKFVREHSKIPVVRHDKGVCHLFVDYNADLEMAEKIALMEKFNVLEFAMLWRLC